MKAMRDPRRGLYVPLGRVLLHANWARSWDGWAHTKAPYQHWKLCTLEWIVGPAGYAMEFCLWRLLLVVGFARTKA